MIWDMNTTAITFMRMITKRYGGLYGKVYTDKEMENVFAYTVEENKKLYNRRQLVEAEKQENFMTWGTCYTNTYANDSWWCCEKCAYS